MIVSLDISSASDVRVDRRKYGKSGLFQKDPSVESMFSVTSEDEEHRTWLLLLLQFVQCCTSHLASLNTVGFPVFSSKFCGSCFVLPVVF